MLLQNDCLLRVLEDSYLAYLKCGSRSNAKLKILHGYIKKVLQKQLSQTYPNNTFVGYSLDTNPECSYEETIKGVYYPKKVDIYFMANNKPLFAVGVKYVMSNYSQNANNYFEAMLGEYANIQQVGIPYYNITILPDRILYFTQQNTIRKEEILSNSQVSKYFNLYNVTDKNAMVPAGMLLCVIDQSNINTCLENTFKYSNFFNSFSKLENKGLFCNNFIGFVDKIVNDSGSLL